MPVALVRGSGDIGSAVAHRLFTAGFGVAVHDSPQPAVTRRGMSFTDAIFHGTATLDGVAGVRVDDLGLLHETLVARATVPIVIADFEAVLAVLQPEVLVDARMRKRAQPEVQRGLARLTIGLGPNFVAGETTDLAVETSWDDLGRVLTTGATLPLAGEPRPIGGHARDRYVYAPVAGAFRTTYHIGDAVQAGSVVAHIGPTALHAPLDGVLRGLTPDGTSVTAGTKVIEVDPRGETSVVTGISERPARIADGVLAAVQSWAASHLA